MPSSYTSSLGIEKIATGEQSGTWGDTTNLNFDIIDRGISGVGTITLSGTTHTLTTTDGTLTDGMYKLLILSGSPSGTNTITISPNDQPKIYFVYNNSGEDATFTQGTGSNVTVGNGDSKVIYADGAGSAAAVSDWTDNLSASSVNITGGSVTGVTLSSSSATVTGGTIDGTTIGGTTPAAGTFTSLTANGNTTLGDANTDTLTINAVIQGASPLVFEGSTADGFETTLAVTDPTADRTLTLPNDNGIIATEDVATALAIALG